MLTSLLWNAGKSSSIIYHHVDRVHRDDVHPPRHHTDHVHDHDYDDDSEDLIWITIRMMTIVKLHQMLLLQE